MRRVIIGLLLAAALLLAARDPARAREIRQGDRCVVGASETLTGNLFALCRALSIEGTVQGNVIGAALDATISGTVTGDVYLAAGQLDVRGRLGGDLHFAGPALRILPGSVFSSADADLISLSLSTTVNAGARVPGSIIALSYQLALAGDTGSDVSFWGSALTIDGRVGGNVDATVGAPEATGVSQLQTLLDLFAWEVRLINPGLLLTERGAVVGDLRYSGPAEGALNGSVSGQTVFTQVISQPDLTQIISEEEGRGGLAVFLSQALREFIILALIGVLGLLFLPRQLQAPIRSIQSRPLPIVSIGLLTFIISFPIAIIGLVFGAALVFALLLLQIDGLAVALFSGTLLGAWLGASSLFYFGAIFVSRVIVCLLIGRFVVRLTLGDDGSQRITYLSLLIGALLLALLTSLPTIGTIISAFSAFVGLGALLNTLQNQLLIYRDRVYGPRPPPVPRRPESVRRLPPPIIDDSAPPPGMDNLPEGFVWWDDDEG